MSNRELINLIFCFFILILPIIQNVYKDRIETIVSLDFILKIFINNSSISITVKNSISLDFE